MIRNNQPISSTDFNKGLVTRDDMLTTNFDQSPNVMDIKWYFDGSVGKRYGSSTTNSVVITSGGAPASFQINSTGTLLNNLAHYWKFDEASGIRYDSVGTNNLTQFNDQPINSITGIVNNAADSNFTGALSSYLIGSANTVLSGTGNWAISFWYYADQDAGGSAEYMVRKSNGNFPNSEWEIFNQGAGVPFTMTLYNTGGTTTSLSATNGSNMTVGQWMNLVAWKSDGSHIGLSVNNVITTAAYARAGTQNSSVLKFMESVANSSYRVDEVGFWDRILTSGERTDIYGGGTGNTYTATQTSRDSWASFDFGASNLRWLTVAMGTGIMASSNRGTTWVTVGSTRTSTWQYFSRSKNVLIATSDAYDVPLYWAGSAGTFAIALANGTGPLVKYSNNYSGFLFLLNSSTNKLSVDYVDENLQLTQATSTFTIPSSLDDEITGSFVLNKFMYIHTRYTIYLVQFVGGNPDFNFYKVRDFGYVPRTVKIIYLDGQQVAQGLDWDNRLRVFDGSNDLINSTPVENDNGYCEFAMQKVSHAGSGLIVSYSEYDTEQQEYRIGLAIGAQSTQTTHHLVLNTRTKAMYPYANQSFNTMVMAESNRTRALMAFDHSGFCHILNSGNLDGGTFPINEQYDSPLIFTKTPTSVSKSHEIDLFFKKDSCGLVQYQDRADLSNVFSKQNPLIELTSTESNILLRRTEDVPSVQNIYQFRLTSSGNQTNAANPWKLVRVDYLQQSLGLGKGGAS